MEADPVVLAITFLSLVTGKVLKRTPNSINSHTSVSVTRYCHETIYYTGYPEKKYKIKTDKKVEILLEIVAKDILIHVETKGEHLSEEEREKIMIPFFRGQQARQKASGVGLGLTIVHRILNMHRGSLTYTPMPKQTNRFTVALPKAGE